MTYIIVRNVYILEIRHFLRIKTMDTYITMITKLISLRDKIIMYCLPPSGSPTDYIWYQLFISCHLNYFLLSVLFYKSFPIGQWMEQKWRAPACCSGAWRGGEGGIASCQERGQCCKAWQRGQISVSILTIMYKRYRLVLVQI